MIRYIRFHGRGGEGVKLACRVVGRAAFLAGATVQDSPLYGAERRGAPVVAFARLGDGPIGERGYVTNPDLVVVMDDSLLDDPEALVLDGIAPTSLVLVNSAVGAEDLRRRGPIAAAVVSLDISAIVLEVLGDHVLSAAAAAFAARAGRLADWGALEQAIALELADAGVTAPRIERNLLAARQVFDRAPAVGLRERPAPPPRPAASLFVLPRVNALLAAPSITAGGSSALRHTDGWRTSRPVIDEARCTRCLLCFVLCPEGAISLAPDNLPKVDYEHCKGCLVCVRECPPACIHERAEGAP
jgi:pyruvate ferredoxin oxidoreductase gamma subunit